MTIKQWIDKYNKEHPIVAGFCYSASHELAREFPELIICRGWAITRDGGRLEHWWCEDVDGKIFDATVAQFRSGVLFYEKFDPDKHGPEPIGKCIGCGCYIFEADAYYGSSTVCSAECDIEVRNSMGF